MFRTGKIKLNPQINLPLNFLTQKYFFHDNLTWNINYWEFVFQVGTKLELELKILELGLNFLELELKILELNWN